VKTSSLFFNFMPSAKGADADGNLPAAAKRDAERHLPAAAKAVLQRAREYSRSPQGIMRLDMITAEAEHAIDLEAATRTLRHLTCMPSSCPSPGSLLGGLPTMVSAKRVLWTMALVKQVLRHGVPGDVLEAGVYRGGTSVAMMRVLADDDAPREPQFKNARLLWACDSFEGLPEPSPLDRCGDRSASPDKTAVHLVGASHCRRGRRGNFRADTATLTSSFHQFGLAASLPRLRTVVGWFSATLPPKGLHALSFLRIDGDLHASTLVSLERLYRLLSPGGVVFIDDYGSFGGCAAAVDTFRRERNISARLHRVVEARRRKRLGGQELFYEAVWWRKALP
jgi:O-methyltransferase